MNIIRKQKVESLLKREISMIIMTEVKDPRVAFVSVHAVSLTKDLKIAHVYISIMGDEKEARKTFKGIKNASGFIRGRVGKAVRLQYTPQLKFEIDQTQDEREKVLKLLKTIEEEGKNDSKPS